MNKHDINTMAEGIREAGEAYSKAVKEFYEAMQYDSGWIRKELCASNNRGLRKVFAAVNRQQEDTQDITRRGQSLPREGKDQPYPSPGEPGSA